MTTLQKITRTRAELKADYIVYLERTLNIRYRGLQPRLNKPPLYLFSCNRTRDTCGSEKLLDMQLAIKNLRKNWNAHNNERT